MSQCPTSPGAVNTRLIIRITSSNMACIGSDLLNDCGVKVPVLGHLSTFSALIKVGYESSFDYVSIWL